MTADESHWQIVWCLDGWLAVADRLEKLLPPWASLKRMDPALPLEQQVRSAQVLIPTTGVVDAAAIDAAADLRLIAQPAAGYENIDIEAAKRRGVAVTTAPGFNSDSVAEVALMMVLMLMRRVDEARTEFLQRRPIGEPAHSRQLKGKVLGIIGMGRIGQRLAAAATGIGMQVLGVTSSSTPDDLRRLLQTCDVVSVHCPLTPRSRGLIGRDELAVMKRGAVLVNCARGHVLDKSAVLEALESGQLDGLGLDVHWQEPADPQDPLYRHPRTLALPHLGCVCEEVYDAMARLLADNIVRAREGRELLHRLC